MDGKKAARMDFDTTRFDFGPWFVREYFLVGRDVLYVLGLGTSRPTVDAATYDEMAARFSLRRWTGPGDHSDRSGALR